MSHLENRPGRITSLLSNRSDRGIHPESGAEYPGRSSPPPVVPAPDGASAAAGARHNKNRAGRAPHDRSLVSRRLRRHGGERHRRGRRRASGQAPAAPGVHPAPRHGRRGRAVIPDGHQGQAVTVAGPAEARQWQAELARRTARAGTDGGRRGRRPGRIPVTMKTKSTAPGADHKVNGG